MLFSWRAPLAQLAEQLTLNQWVLGSSPRRCTEGEGPVVRRNPGPSALLRQGQADYEAARRSGAEMSKSRPNGANLD